MLSLLGSGLALDVTADGVTTAALLSGHKAEHTSGT